MVSLVDLWGKAVLIMEKMGEIEPLVLGEENEKKALFEKIKDYFKEQGKLYLDKYLR